MPFTDRYIKLPTTVYDKKEHDVLGDDAPQQNVTTRLNLLELCYYEETDCPQNKGNYNYTQVVLKSGQGFIVMLTIDEFERRINDFMK